MGIPTGGCNSRQTADCLLHYLVEKVKGDIPTWNLLKQFKRFIDDIFTLWLGTRRQFDSFVARLNQLCGAFGSSSRGCLTCPTIVQDNEGLCVDGRILSPGIQLNCKSSNVIYLSYL